MSRRDQIRALDHLVKRASKGGADPRLTADEVLAVRSGGAHPNDYVALPVQVNVDQGRQGMIASTPEGPVIVMPLVLGVPVKHVRVSRVLGSDGQVKSPLEGMLPTLFARLVVPRARLTAEVLAQLDAFEEQPVNGIRMLTEEDEG